MLAAVFDESLKVNLKFIPYYTFYAIKLGEKSLFLTI